ncbi:6-pyruvoyl trahydropterin synthase family protein [Streptomyces sp. NPDC049879]|uniref:6-pyruvoyl trahydropterin synthase family protein n=1 Tax=Streptomyces sp. NPDC049879 TaxID=3365598 RepID=UPI0037B2DADE
MSGTTILEVRHAFDAAHRLPVLPGKCQSLHGHTWRITARVRGPVDGTTGIVTDMGGVKDKLRAFVDMELDHGTLLGEDDPLVATLGQFAMKVFVFDGDRGGWPTVENVAALIGERLQEQLPAGVTLVDVRVAETDTNAATWSPGGTA